MGCRCGGDTGKLKEVSSNVETWNKAAIAQSLLLSFLSSVFSYCLVKVSMEDISSVKPLLHYSNLFSSCIFLY